MSELPAFPYAREARSALRKLGFDLGAFASTSLADAPRTAGGGTAGAAAPGVTPSFFPADASTAAVADRLRTLADALFARKKVAFTYHGMERGETTQREVHPFGLLFQQSRWYLVAFDPMRAGMRVFRVDRMDELTRNDRSPNTPDYEIPASFRLSEYALREPWQLGQAPDGPVRAQVRFEFPRSLWAERNGHGELVEEHDDGSSLRAFDVTQPDPFLRWILSMAGDASIVSPPELAEDLRRMARRVAAAHGAVA